MRILPLLNLNKHVNNRPNKTNTQLKGIDTITLRACSDELNECVEIRFIIHLIGLASVANRVVGSFKTKRWKRFVYTRRV